MMTFAPQDASSQPHRRGIDSSGPGGVPEGVGRGEEMRFLSRHLLPTGVRSGLEVQIRWPRPWRGAGEGGAGGRVVSFGGRVLRAACREAERWSLPWRISVGVAACQITQGRLLAQVAEALDDSGLDPERLELELSEATLLEADGDMLLMLSALRDLGTGVGLDDFGAGLASLSLLRHLPLSSLKLDATLVRNLPADPEDCALVDALVVAAHGAGLEVVAAGIDSEPQRGFLVESGCDAGQGRLFGGAAPAGAFRPD